MKNLNTKAAVRFNELKKLIPKISNTVLSEILLELEHQGSISKDISTGFIQDRSWSDNEQGESTTTNIVSIK